MFEQIEDFRRKLNAGTFCVGAGISFADPAVTEALAPTVDFLWIDLEHSPLNMESLQAHLIAARAGGAPAVVRVPTSDVAWIKRALDTGATGIVVPQIQSADEARRAVDACRYPPAGNRGFGPRRPSNYGRMRGADYVQRANQNVFTVVQIESRGALDELEGILALPELDSIVIGPYDLSGALGRLGDLAHPDVQSAIQTIIDRARAAGKLVGMGMAADAIQARAAARRGVHWVQCGGDYNYLVQEAERLFAAARAE
jgi:2-keto-3-deoxy-L-rhamnonate aldolase RhmA